MKHKYQWVVFPCALAVVAVTAGAIAMFAPAKPIRVEAEKKTTERAKPKPVIVPKIEIPVSAEPLQEPQRQPLQLNNLENHIDLNQQPVVEEDIDEERTWIFTDGSLLKGYLDGVTEDLSTAFISGKASNVKVEMARMSENDKLFCKKMLSRYGNQIVFAKGVDLTQYGVSFQKLETAIEEFAESTIGDDVTTAQKQSLSLDAYDTCCAKVHGLVLKIPVVVLDAQMIGKQGRKLKVQLATQSLYNDIAFRYAHVCWMTESELLKQNKGDVWWLKTKIDAVDRDSLGMISISFDPADFLPRQKTNRKLRSGHMKLGLSVESAERAADMEAIDLLNKFNWKVE
jgi:hypothetical protein